eukprot:CAMPEP_0116157212 /NCGR_PEP_ID=MMETSP0329-20121206/23227_1 /TAXON_ID=697910 /ORGANISM="Pseudo-nitzschia arenysensis, Strain B593" /LENGTH=134 /DNA_ID=CAMNT_0003654311 /DNA_START=214 /DNA_END=614 /DNA_ORIENTATION=+
MPARRHHIVVVQRLKRNDFQSNHRIGNGYEYALSKKNKDESREAQTSLKSFALGCFRDSPTKQQQQQQQQQQSKDNKTNRNKSASKSSSAHRRRSLPWKEEEEEDNQQTPSLEQTPTKDTLLEESSVDTTASTT